jgi:hypothetical protein
MATTGEKLKRHERTEDWNQKVTCGYSRSPLKGYCSKVFTAREMQDFDSTQSVI